MNVPVMVLNWNGWDDTLSCLRSLSESGEASNVWLVDNGSFVDRSDDCRKVFPELRVLRLAHNYGWAGAYNKALGQALDEGHQMAYLLNNDTIVHPRFLSTPCDTMLSDTRLAAIGSVIVYEGGQWVRFNGRYYNGHKKPFLYHPKDQLRFSNGANGAGMLVQLAAIQKSGWFDERFFCYGEETDWCWRMRDCGWQIGTAPSSVVYHKCQGSDTNANARYYRCRNKFLLLAKHRNRVRWRSKEDLAADLLAKANACWNPNLETIRHAIIAGLQDGLEGRFGQRPEYESADIASV